MTNLIILLLRSELHSGICRWRKWAPYKAAGWARSTQAANASRRLNAGGLTCCYSGRACRRQPGLRDNRVVPYVLTQPVTAQSNRILGSPLVMYNKLECWHLTCQFQTQWSPESVQHQRWQLHLRIFNKLIK